MTLRKQAEKIRKVGYSNSGQDSMLAHITPKEAGLLRLFGGSGRQDPHTGLPHFDHPTIGGTNIDPNAQAGLVEGQPNFPDYSNQSLPQEQQSWNSYISQLYPSESFTQALEQAGLMAASAYAGGALGGMGDVGSTAADTASTVGDTAALDTSQVGALGDAGATGASAGGGLSSADASALYGNAGYGSVNPSLGESLYHGAVTGAESGAVSGGVRGAINGQNPLTSAAQGAVMGGVTGGLGGGVNYGLNGLSSSTFAPENLNQSGLPSIPNSYSSFINNPVTAGVASTNPTLNGLYTAANVGVNGLPALGKVAGGALGNSVGGPIGSALGSYGGSQLGEDAQNNGYSLGNLFNGSNSSNTGSTGTDYSLSSGYSNPFSGTPGVGNGMNMSTVAADPYQLNTQGGLGGQNTGSQFDLSGGQQYNPNQQYSFQGQGSPVMSGQAPGATGQVNNNQFGQGNASQGIGGALVNGLLGLYANNKLGGQINQLQGMYGPNSPYAQQLTQQLNRQAAANGSRSQAGTRAVELQAALAGNAAKLAPTIDNMQMQQMRNLGGSLSGILGNSSVQPYLNQAGQYFGLNNLFGGPSNNNQPQINPQYQLSSPNGLAQSGGANDLDSFLNGGS